MNRMLIVLAALLLTPPLVLAGGNHYGETKDLDVRVEYFDYAYKLPNGEPVYYIGTPMRFRVSIKNQGHRTYRHFETRSQLRWVGNYSCTRWWLDGSKASYFDGNTLPGDSVSDFHDAEMRFMSETGFQTIYNIPLEICPGRGEVIVEGRHKNRSGRDEVGLFRIPIRVALERKP